MKKTEIVLVLCSLAAVTLRLYSIEGSTLLTTLFLLLLALFYVLFGFLLFNAIRLKDVFKKAAYKGAGWKRICWSVVTGASFFIIIIGVLFRVNRWPGGLMLVNSSLVFLFPLFLVSLVRFLYNRSRYHAGIWIRSAILLLVAVAFLIQGAMM